MHRALCLVSIALALSPVNVSWAASPVGGSAGIPHSRPADRVLRLSFRVYAPMPAGSVIICKARLEGAGGSSAPGEAVVPATGIRSSSSVCAIEIPMSWGGSSAVEGGILCYEIEARDHQGVPARTIAAGRASLPVMPTGQGDVDVTMQVTPVR